MQKKKKKKKGWGGVLFGGGLGVEELEVIVKMQEKKKAKGEELAKVDVNEELKVRIDLTKN